MARIVRQFYTGQLPSEYLKVAKLPQRTANGIITRQRKTTGPVGGTWDPISAVLQKKKRTKKQKPKKSSSSSKKTINPKPACSGGWTWCSEATKRAILAQKQTEKASKQTKPTKPKSNSQPTNKNEIDLATAKVIFQYFRLPPPPPPGLDSAGRKAYTQSWQANPVHNQIRNAQREAKYYADNPQLNTIIYVIVGQTDGDFNSYQFFVSKVQTEINNLRAARPYQIFENGRWRWKTQAERRAKI